MEIKITNNYDMFKFKKENREINYNKILSLKAKLIEDKRQIMPIICNRDMEIMDGQHRFVALKELNWDVMYYVDDFITGKELISINNTQKNWGLLDYIHFYASSGNNTYIRLENICKKYNDIPLKVITLAISKKTIKEYVLKSGEMEFTDEEFDIGEKTLEFIKDIKNNIKVKITNPSTFFCLLIKTYYLEGIDRNKLRDSVIARYGTENYGSALQCSMVIEHWYNFKCRSYRYISNEILPRR